MAGGRDGAGDVPDGPGWYPDPWSATGEGERYFDGRHWGTTEKPLARHTHAVAEASRPVTGGRPAHGWGRRIGQVGVLVLVVGLAWVYWHNQQDSDDSASSDAGHTRSVAATDRPPASTEEQPKPLGHPAAVPTGSGQYELLAHQRGDPTTPVAFDPCRPVHYVVNPAGAPVDGLGLVQSAIARVSTATGLDFVYDGATSEAPDKDREPFLPKVYGAGRWAPVLISWADESTFPALAGYIAGIGSAQPVYARDNRLVDVTGEVVLDAEQLSPAEVPDRAQVRAIILHELGHVVGLDHTSDRSQIMFSESQFNVSDYADGDLRGLAVLGTQDCFPDV